METRKICRLLTVFFVILNVLFVSLYCTEYRSTLKLDDDFAENTVKNLNGKNIEISKDSLVLNVPENRVYAFNLPDSKVYSEGIAKKVSDFCFDRNTTIVSFDVPGGVSVSIYDAASDGNQAKELAKLMINPSQHFFHYTNSGYVLKKDVPESKFTSYSTDLTSDTKSIVESFVKVICPGDNYDFEIIGSSQTEGCIVVTVKQTIDGCELQELYLNVVLKNNEILGAKGKWICTPVKDTYKNVLVDGINALYKLDLDNIKTIKSQKIVYTPRSIDDKKHYLLPVWEISCTDTNENDIIVYVDAIE